MDFIMKRYVRRIRVLWRFNTITFAKQQAPELSHAHIFQIILKYFSVDSPNRGEIFISKPPVKFIPPHYPRVIFHHLEKRVFNYHDFNLSS